MNVLRVLVCGTNYGRSYLEAIRLGGSSYRLVGILARGSARSQRMAAVYGVPLFRTLADLDREIDFACAAMGASGSEVLHGLLARNIHVLCEHPVKLPCLQSAITTAGSRGLCFHINGHFADLEAAAAFIHRARQESQSALPSFFQVTATDRSLYATLDILGRILESFLPFHFQVTSEFSGFVVVQGMLGGVPSLFHIQRGNDALPYPDGSPRYLVDHRIAAAFPSGILTLLSMNGPVIWNTNLNCSNDPAQSVFSIVHENRDLTTARLERQRIAANLRAIEAMVAEIREGVRPAEQQSDYLLELSRTWETLGSLL